MERALRAEDFSVAGGAQGDCGWSGIGDYYAQGELAWLGFLAAAAAGLIAGFWRVRVGKKKEMHSGLERGRHCKALHDSEDSEAAAGIADEAAASLETSLVRSASGLCIIIIIIIIIIRRRRAIATNPTMSSTTPSTQDIICVLEVTSSPKLLELAGHDAWHEGLAHQNVVVAVASENPGSAGTKRDYHFVTLL